jgi:integrase
VHDEVGYATAKRTKVVLSGICGYALRHGAMTSNPAKSVEAMSAPKSKPIRVLEPEQRADFLAKLRVHVAERATEGGYDLGPRARSWTDLPDIAEAMLATGARLGEILAVIGDDVDPGTRRVVMDHHLVRIAGQGIVRVPLRKGDGEGLTLVFPTWATPLFRRRKLESGGGVLFPAWNDKLVDPSNVTKRFRKACDAIGYGEVSSHVFRHTVGTHLGDAGMASTAIADQLGNTGPVVEKHYRRKRVANERIAESLESLMSAEDAG